MNNNDINKTDNGSNTKINFSLQLNHKNKKVKKKVTTEFQNNNGDAIIDEEQFKTIAEAAIYETNKRKELGIDLIIPLDKDDEIKHKKEPLLFGRKRIIEGDDILLDRKDNNTVIGKQNDEENIDNNDKQIAGINNDISNNDAEAEDALIQLAADNIHSKEQTNDSSMTNFASGGPSSMIIKQQQEDEGSNNNNIHDPESIKYQRDLKQRADDISVHSNAYVNVPIAEFGAAMLRGMGWKSKDKDAEGKVKNDKEFNPRPHRLGLGATPLPPSMRTNGKGGDNKRHRARKAGTMEDIANLEKEKEEERLWKKNMEEKQRKDPQVTLQVGSIVRVRNVESDNNTLGQRAKMIKIAGVPGLNRVLIRYEDDNNDVSVKKSDVVLVERAELQKVPFREALQPHGDLEQNRSHNNDRSQSQEKKVSKSQEKKKRDRRERSYSSDSSRRHHKSSSSRIKRDEKRYDSQSYKKPRRDRDDYDKRERDHKSHRRSHDRDKSDKHDYRDRKKSRHETYDEQSAEHWLTPNIRVRVVTKKIAKGRQFKQKGVVVDVVNQGSHAVIHMDDGEIIERVPERYLETALPKVGGNVIVLTGSSQFAKGKLLERSSSKGVGVIQLFENMNIITLSLDDIAEWCGSLDEDCFD